MSFLNNSFFEMKFVPSEENDRFHFLLPKLRQILQKYIRKHRHMKEILKTFESPKRNVGKMSQKTKN